MKETFRSLRVRDFRLWFAGAFVSNIGTWMQATAQNWVVLSELTESDATALGVTAALQFAPPVLLAPVAGWLADHVDRRRLMMATQSTMLLLGVLLGVLLLFDLAELWHLFFLAGGLGVATALENPTRLTFVTDLVPPRDASNAVALNAAAFNLGRLIGPAVAGILIVATGSAVVFFLNAITFVVLLVVLSALRPDGRRSGGPPLPARRGEALGYVWSRPDIVLVMLVVFMVGIFGMNFPIFTSTMALEFRMGADGFGLLTAVFSAGSLLGSLHVASRPRARARVVLFGLACFAAVTLLSSAAPNAPVYGVALVALGYSVSTTFITANGYVQTTSDPAVRGRVMALYAAMFAGGAPIGSLLLGVFTDLFGPRGAILIAGAAGTVTLFATVVWLAATGRLRYRSRRTVELALTMPIPVLVAERSKAVSDAQETGNSASEDGQSEGAEKGPDMTIQNTKSSPSTMTVVLGANASAAARRKASAKRTGTGRLWLFVLPAALFFVFVVIVPSAQGLFYSLTNWDGLARDWDFVGFANYALIFSDPIAVRALTNTILYAVLTTVFENVFGLLIALGLHSRIKSRNILRVAFFMPVVLLSLVIAYLWQFLFLPNNGVFVQMLTALGIDASRLNMLGSPDTVVFGIAVMVIWQFTGFTMIIYLAGLQGVPQELLESASLDGAGPWQRFWNVVRPMLAPALTVNLILSMIRGFMIFDQIWATTLGGPADSSHSLSTLVYRTAFTFGKLGQGAALAVALTVFVAIFGFFQYRVQMRSKGNS